MRDPHVHPDQQIRYEVTITRASKVEVSSTGWKYWITMDSRGSMCLVKHEEPCSIHTYWKEIYPRGNIKQLLSTE